MNGRIVFFTLISTFLLLALVVAASATTRTVGVSVGDKFRYSTTSSWSSTDPSATPTADLVDANNTEWLEFTVTAISSTNITVQGTRHYKDGTETTNGVWIDINTGEPINGNLTTVLVSANLAPGDSIYTSSMYNTWFINETVTRTYLGVGRPTNHFDMTASSGTQSYLLDFYWDKSTGVVVKLQRETTTQTGAYTTTGSLSAQLISSNMWTVPEFPTWTPALLILTAFTSATIVIARRKQPRTPFH
jgi:hypothetical protein